MSGDQVTSQLNRIKGQLEGVIAMYQEQRDCVDVTRQILAIRGSLSKVARVLLSSEASRCTRERRIGDLDKVLEEVLRH